MKVIATDNFNRDHVPDRLIASNVPQPYADAIVAFLIERYSGHESVDYFRAVPDDYTSTGEEGEVNIETLKAMIKWLGADAPGDVIEIDADGEKHGRTDREWSILWHVAEVLQREGQWWFYCDKPDWSANRGAPEYPIMTIEPFKTWAEAVEAAFTREATL